MNLAMSIHGDGDDDNHDGHYHIDANFDDDDNNADNVDGDDDNDANFDEDDNNADNVEGDGDNDDYVEVYRQNSQLAICRTHTCLSRG